MKLSKNKRHELKRKAKRKLLSTLNASQQEALNESIVKRVKKTEARQKAASAAARKRRQNENNR